MIQPSSFMEYRFLGVAQLDSPWSCLIYSRALFYIHSSLVCMELIGSWLHFGMDHSRLGPCAKHSPEQVRQPLSGNVFLKTVSSSGSSMGVNSIWVMNNDSEPEPLGGIPLPCVSLIWHIHIYIYVCILIHVYMYIIYVYLPLLCLPFIDRSKEASKRRAVRCWFGDKKNMGVRWQCWQGRLHPYFIAG